MNFGPGDTSNVYVTQEVRALTGDRNLLAFNKSVVNKYSDSVELRYYSTSATNGINITLNDTVIYSAAAVGNLTTSIVLDNSYFSGSKIGEQGIATLNTSGNTTLRTDSFIISGTTTPDPIIREDIYDDDILNSNWLWAAIILVLFALIGYTGGKEPGGAVGVLIAMVLIMVSELLPLWVGFLFAVLVFVAAAATIYKALGVGT